MSARDDLKAYAEMGPDPDWFALLDAYAAEVRAATLREAADATEPGVIGYGGPDHRDAFETAHNAVLWLLAEEKS